MANKLLIPVDFSQYSQKAIEYACLLSRTAKHSLVLIHVFTDHINVYRNSIENTDLLDPRVAEAKNSMEKLISDIKEENPEIRISSVFSNGNLFEEIEKIASKDNYDAIIMGTKGSSGLDSLLIGSNMFDVFQNTQTPVLAVPYSEKAYRAEKIGLLCNFKDGEIDVLKQATALYNQDFELLLIHINTADESIQALDSKFAAFIERIIDETGIDNISYTIKTQAFLIQYKEDISSAIDSVIADELLDVLLVTKSKKGFLRKIIEENIVKRMAYQIQIPKFFAKSNI
ncbi:universal stress protein [Sphingobacterium faecale]|uniref:Universal stress protein n=1 Tax=Sphingobacterium faecale TaxID=2803775 RepID=A0ABS1R7A3_9SPHI|nr:universal stress protein [Sphingobacterium faecale]MBL1409882.1 universal stress protein [Sphingobacterium faecale]